MKLSKIIIAFYLGGFLAGCTTAGPYVTNISSDGANGLNIEKCKVELNAFLGVVNTGECSNSSIKLINSIK
jgi:type IV secretion system protein VirB7